jgi:hypothetical protein
MLWTECHLWYFDWWLAVALTHPTFYIFETVTLFEIHRNSDTFVQRFHRESRQSGQSHHKLYKSACYFQRHLATSSNLMSRLPSRQANWASAAPSSELSTPSISECIAGPKAFCLPSPRQKILPWDVALLVSRGFTSGESALFDLSSGCTIWRRDSQE